MPAGRNVFGLDESVRPTPADLRAHLTEAPWALEWVYSAFTGRASELPEIW